jgi:plastocyanin
MRARTIGIAAAFAAATALTIAACGGGGGGSPTSPSPGGGSGGGGTGTSAATIVIGADGRVQNPAVTVPVGSRVSFQNNSSRAHDMSSDPHPQHTDCPELNVGNLQPGQTRQSQNLNTARTCGYHDHNEPDNESLKGSIRIQ